MHLFQLLIAGTCWVHHVSADQWYGPFDSYASAFDHAESIRTPGMQIRNKGLLRVPPAKWIDPSEEGKAKAKAEADAKAKAEAEAKAKAEAEAKREGTPVDLGKVETGPLVKPDDLTDKEKADASPVRPALIEEIGRLSVAKMGKRLGELTADELEILKTGEERGSAVRAIDKAIAALD